MFDELLYHGTNRIRGNRIIGNNKMEITVGDDHWLGDGSYFFIEDFFSYKWIVDMHNKRYSNVPTIENLLENYLILKGNIITKKDRVFDLSKAEHKIIFDEVYAHLNKKKEYSQRFLDREIAEGVVINYMFNELNFLDDFDLVKAIFTLNQNKYQGVPTRLGYMSQEQICVKNLECVKRIEEYDFTENVATYEYMIRNMYFNNIIEESITDGKNITYKYSTQKKRKKYPKRV